MDNESSHIISQTKKWITDMVIGCNFCPFASKVMKQNAIHYAIETSAEMKLCLLSLLDECTRLNENANIETSFLIFPQSFSRFDDYLNLVSHAENVLKKKGYEGKYQVASFHPLYCFAKSNNEDAANFTNRSPYPMLHILREERIEKALLSYAHPEKIPENNINFAHTKGYDYMVMLREACLIVEEVKK